MSTEAAFIAKLLAADSGLRDRLTYGTKPTVSMSEKLDMMFAADPKLRGDFGRLLGVTMQQVDEAFYTDLLNGDGELRSQYDEHINGGKVHKKFFIDLLKKRPDIKSQLDDSRKQRRGEIEGEFYTATVAERPELAADDGDGNFNGEEWFYTMGGQLLYRAAIEPIDGVPRYKTDEFTLDIIVARAEEMLRQYQEAGFGIGKDDIGKQPDEAKAAESLATIVAELEETMHLGVDDGEPIHDTIKSLKAMRLARENYIKDAQSWLLRHATSPNARLTRVWSDRADALAGGANDSARDIEQWLSEKSLYAHIYDLDRRGQMPSNLTVEEVKTKWLGWVGELSRAYGSETTIRAISRFKNESNPNALLPARVIDLKTPDGVFKAEVLAKDDPRGCTIGVDTGCCMHLNGESEACIWSGYRDEDAGFFVLYTPEGRISAQSYFYSNPKHPEVLVMDNIEANIGRNTDKIVGLYQQALRQYLTDRFAEDDKWSIRTVQVGTGYGDAVKSSVLKLPHADAIRNSRVLMYTDAHQQRMMLELTDAQIAQARKKGSTEHSVEQAKPVHTPKINTTTMQSGHAQIIRELERQIYPKTLRYYQDKSDLKDELEKPGLDKFSFLVSADADATVDYVGYCMAYLDDSLIDGHEGDEVIYAADMALLPEAQGGRTGMRMFEELLRRASEHAPHLTIEMHAREKTSYAVLKRTYSAKRLLEEYGYTLVDHGVADEFDNGEKLYLISLERSHNTVL